MADDEQSHTTLYGGASPIFDVPEFPPLRRVVPLPKRRRIIDATSNILPKSIQAERERQSQTTPDELAHTLSTSMALHSYYMPLFNGAPSALFKNDDIDARHVDPTDLTPHAGDDGYADGRDNGDRDDGDYTDHLMQPGNTKKRKVPVTAHSRAGDDTLGILDGEEDLFADRAFLPDRGEAAAVEVVPPAPPPSAVGLQHKEMLKSRKRQLAAVLGALSHGDTLALDQALSSSYPFTKSVQHKKEQDAGGPPIRLSRRLARRNARALIVTSQGLPALPTNDIAKIPDCSFTFEYDSPTSERLRATKEEVAFLHGRFEAELSRQAARAAEAARQAALVVSQMQKSKRNDRSQQRARIAGQFPGGAASESAPTNSEKAVLTSKSKAKKKKRSALANASNPHHLRNYVPSRLPHSGPLHSAQAAINAQNHLSPPPLRFLSAELPPRKKSAVTASPLASLTSPEDEWICAFCEYSLFYGDEHSYRRTIRQRKKILSRRRRAMERASAAAAGRKKGVASPDKEDSVGDDQTDAFDVPSPEVQTTSKHAKLREEQDRDRDKDGEHGAY
ncbi:hypothetical protein DFH11DRAFT_1542351 [Phellopilus nigrolimitatus]|nr:hypothetical protein DFH11DRAFT_1542351 [Phellopilus nigrolimitatus]